MEPPLMAVVPTAFVVRLVKAVVPPTTPPKVVVPVLFAFRLKAPLSVLPNAMSPAPVSKIVLAPSVTGLLNVIALFVVVRLPLSVVAPV